jgi:hypothetical protein
MQAPRAAAALAGRAGTISAPGLGGLQLAGVTGLGNERPVRSGLAVASGAGRLMTASRDPMQCAAQGIDNGTQRLGTQPRPALYLALFKPLSTLSVMSCLGWMYTASWITRSYFSASATCLMTRLAAPARLQLFVFAQVQVFLKFALLALKVAVLLHQLALALHALGFGQGGRLALELFRSALELGGQGFAFFSRRENSCSSLVCAALARLDSRKSGRCSRIRSEVLGQAAPPASKQTRAAARPNMRLKCERGFSSKGVPDLKLEFLDFIAGLLANGFA